MGRPLETEREAPPLGYELAQFTSNSPYIEKSRTLGEVTEADPNGFRPVASV